MYVYILECSLHVCYITLLSVMYLDILSRLDPTHFQMPVELPKMAMHAGQLSIWPLEFNSHRIYNFYFAIFENHRQ